MVVEAGLRGAFLLSRGRAEGLMLIEETPAGAGRSFWAAAISLPAFLALLSLRWSAGVAPAAGFATALTAELLGYVVIWLGFALASEPLARATGRLREWPHFLAAWNWANVVQYLVLLGLTVPAALGLPDFLADGLALAAIGYALWLEWFVARHALLIGGGRAVAFVLLDLALGIFIGGFVARVTGAG
jgi:hypothetical protein